MFLASVALAVSAMLIRTASQTLDTFVIVFFRALFGVAIITPLMFWPRRLRFRPKKPGLIVLRGLTAFIVMSLWFHALALLPTGEAVALNFTAPMFVTLLAAVFLHETIRTRRLFAIIIGLAGVLIILQPGFGTVHWVHFLPLAAAFFMGCSSVLVRRLIQDEPPNTLIFYSALIVLPLVTPFALFNWTAPSGWEWGLLLAIGAATTAVHQCLTRAYRAAEAGLIAGMSFLRLPMATLAAWLVFNEWPDGSIWIGGALIITANIFLASREALATKVEERADQFER